MYMLHSHLLVHSNFVFIDTDPNETLGSSETKQFAKDLPEELLVPSNQIRILNSEAIGQGTVQIVFT